MTPVSPSTRLTLSQLTSIPVRAARGEIVGRVIDVGIDALSSAPTIDRVQVGGRGRTPMVLPWSLVDMTTGVDDDLRLSVDAADLQPHATSTGPRTGHRNSESVPPGLWLRRDVLDSQVVDLTGGRLSRVSEIFLVVGEDGSLAAFAVDLGLGALLARMGLGRVGRHLPEVAAAWDDLYLASTGGHEVELSVSSQRLRRLDTGAVSEIVARLRTAQAADVLRAVDPSHAATALAASHEDLRRRLLQSLPPQDRTVVEEAGHKTQGAELSESVRDADGVGRRFRRTAGWRVRRPEKTEQ